MGYIEDFVTEIRQSFFARTPNVQEFSDVNLKKSIEGAVQLYSKYRPRTNRRGTATLTAGEYGIDLEDDFMQCSLDELYYVLTGSKPQSTSRSSRYHSRGILSVFDSVLGATTDPPPFVSYQGLYVTPDGLYISSSDSGASVKLTTSDTGGFSIVFANAIQANTTRDYWYDAFHSITTSVFTVPPSDRDIVMDLAIAQTLRVLAQDLLTQPSATKSYGVANQFLTMAKEYDKSIHRITPRAG